MNKKSRMQILNELTKTAAIQKKAEELADDVNMADEDPQVYADKIFDALLEEIKSNIKIEGLDE